MNVTPRAEPGDNEKLGRVRVILEGMPPGGEPVVEIRDASLNLQVRARAGQHVELKAGVYVVSAALPDGGSPSRGVDVAAGKDTDVDLGAVSPSGDAIAEEAVLPPIRSVSHGRLLTRLRSLRRPTLHARVVAQGPGAVRLGDPEWEPRVIDKSKLEDATYLELAVERPRTMSLAQFAVGNDIPTNVVLPLHSAARTAEADLQVTFNRFGAIDPVAVPTGSPEIALIAGYMRTGQVAVAAEVAAQAEYLLESKEANPVAAALGGFALLRVGATRRLHDWPTNLADRFPWLPDGPVIAGELSAREGEDTQAAEWFIDALGRGYPMFSDGLSLLASRLRQYLYWETPPPAVLEHEEDVRRLIRKIPFVDFSQLAVTFKGLDVDDPAGSQDQLPRREARAWTTLSRS